MYLGGMPNHDTPLMQQWREAKAKDPSALLAFRVGDFYEFFNEDAEKAAPLLSLTLTARNNGNAAKTPLAGFPAKALPEYVRKLVQLGERVSICEQTETPAQALGSVVKREVVETITPGTVLDDALLDAGRSSFLVALVKGRGDSYGSAALELTTGELIGMRFPADDLEAELGKVEPAELLLPRSLSQEPSFAESFEAAPAPRTLREDWYFDPESCGEEVLRAYGLHSLDGLGVEPSEAAIITAVGALIRYVKEVKPTVGGHLRRLRVVRSGHTMLLDEMTRRNLEIVTPLRPGETDVTLLSVLDDTATPMGARLLRRWLLEPLLSLEEIDRRHDAVERLVSDRPGRKKLASELSGVGDLDRLAGKLSLGRGAPRDLAWLRDSLRSLPGVRDTVRSLRATALFEAGPSGADGAPPDTDAPPDTGRKRTAATDLLEAAADLDLVADALSLLDSALADRPPQSLAEGGVIREGWCPELDELRAARDGAQDFIASMERREREATGIPSLKMGYNRVFGYFIEVTRPKLDQVPEHYLRRQSLKAAERFVTPELKEWEEKVVDAELRMADLEAQAFAELRERMTSFVPRLRKSAARIGELDVLSSFASVAVSRRYVRPSMHEGYALEVRGSRHPVVEAMMPSGEFIPNDVVLDREKNVVLLTGPNMAGKSTVLRQIGLIQLLAQTGSFVPVTDARIPVADRIFTRVGASDNLSRGHSTFMVEMNETAAIINGAGVRSLILLDEIGRGTSTYDGVSIAWAVTEHIHDRIGAKTLFATHYHELTRLAERLRGVSNLKVLVKEVDENIVFLRKLAKGEADRSYGVQVARIAGLPTAVVNRAKALLTNFEGRDETAVMLPEPTKQFQLSVFNADHPVVSELRSLNPDDLSPRQALELVYRLVRETMKHDE